MLSPRPDLPFWISILVSRPGAIWHVAGSPCTTGSLITGAATASLPATHKRTCYSCDVRSCSSWAGFCPKCMIKDMGIPRTRLSQVHFYAPLRHLDIYSSCFSMDEMRNFLPEVTRFWFRSRKLIHQKQKYQHCSSLSVLQQVHKLHECFLTFWWRKKMTFVGNEKAIGEQGTRVDAETQRRTN